MTISTALEAINTPPLVSGASLVTVSLVPVLEQAIVKGAIPFIGVKILNLLFYFLNVYATAQPGRIDDRMLQEDLKKAPKEIKVFSAGRRGRTLLMPQGWGFAIWGPIFAGELAFCSSTALFVKKSAPIAPIIKYASGGFIGSQVLQTLWAASFRPKYADKAMFVSSAVLSGVAYCLSRAHNAFVLSGNDLATYCIYFLPLTLHFAWSTAAALVNLNGNIAAVTADAKVIAWTGHLSALGATALGVFVTWSRSAPVYGSVIAWALLACSAGMEQRLKETVKENRMNIGVYGARTQKWLCGVGAVICLVTSVFTAGKLL